MSTGNNQWTWDNNRGDWFCWSAAEGCWVGRRGGKVYAQGQSVTQPTATNQNTQYAPTNLARQRGYSSGSNGTYPSDLSDQRFAYSTNQSPYYRSFPATNVPLQSGVPAANYSQQYGYTSPSQSAGYAGLSGASYGAAVASSSQPLSWNTAPSASAASQGPIQKVDESGAKWNTDPTLYAKGVSSYRRIRGTPGETGSLWTVYETPSNPSEFFKRGKVFRMIWPEMAGSGTGHSTNITTCQYGEGVFVKVKWFVVIKATTGSCTCLPIQTYSGRGVSKNVVKHHHAIIYTGASEPEPLPEEKPASGRERGMLDSIRVNPTIEGQSMDPMSRINFRKVYTVEYNVKVWEFGNVDKTSLRYLKLQFDQVWDED